MGSYTTKRKDGIVSVTITNTTFDKEVIQSTIPVIADFWAEWCAPCKMVAPVLEEISKEYEGKLKVAKINVDENQELAEKYQIVSIPTLLVIKDGDIIKKQVGAIPKHAILDLVSEVI